MPPSILTFTKYIKKAKHFEEKKLTLLHPLKEGLDTFTAGFSTLL